MAVIERGQTLRRLAERFARLMVTAATQARGALAVDRRLALRVSEVIGTGIVASALAATSVWANPCNKTLYPTPPNCQARSQAGISYGGWETKGWAYYCTGDHPYYWRPYFEGNNSCFSIAENKFDETQNNKFSATITNWCFNRQTLVVSIACSSDEQPRSCLNSLAPDCPFGP